MQAVMLGSSSSLYVMLPCVIFSVSIALAFATGTSYGTFGVMIPIVIAVVADSRILRRIYNIFILQHGNLDFDKWWQHISGLG